MVNDTIAAICTGLTNSGIGKIRLSGSDAIAVADSIFKSPGGKRRLSEAKSHTIHYGYIYDGGTLIDEVLVLVMRAPNTYTREDVVEIDCHGGIIVMNRLLDTVIKYGARPAQPGEYTKRAFLNGRIDLTQAEAVIDVINAKSDMALSSSVRQLKGNILEKVKAIRKSIIGNVAFIEAAMDDPEHINADHFGQELKTHVEENIKVLRELLSTADNGRMIKEGIKTVIVGKPNAGKSSLMNILVGDERAIVTDIAGTTRDTLEEFVNIHGIPLNIVDTAGIRQTADTVEKIGVHKAKTFARNADLIIYVVDGSIPLDDNDKAIIELIQDKNVIILINKIDLENVTTKDQITKKLQKPVIEISASTEQGIDEFVKCLKQMFFKGDIQFNDEIYITNARHKKAIADALNSLELVLCSIEDGMPEDFYSIDLMNAYNELGSLIGETASEDLIDTIFSDFCMGK